MKVSVVYRAQLRRLMGAAEECIALRPPATLAQLFRDLAGKHGDKLNAILTPTGEPLPALLIFRGNDQVVDLNTPLAEGDRITLLTPMAGG